jgi:osmotically-inducible protein OsmY
MKIKILTIFSLATVLFLGGCRGDSNVNANMANRMNANANMTAGTSTTDSAAKSAVESALKAKGFNDVSVDATTTEVTLRGSVAKDKLSEVIQIANETGKRKVNNQLTLK